MQRTDYYCGNGAAHVRMKNVEQKEREREEDLIILKNHKQR